jgi:hypothetical protein
VYALDILNWGPDTNGGGGVFTADGNAYIGHPHHAELAITAGAIGDTWATVDDHMQLRIGSIGFPAGVVHTASWFYSVDATGLDVEVAQLRLYNVDDSAVILGGMSIRPWGSGSSYGISHFSSEAISPGTLPAANKRFALQYSAAVVVYLYGFHWRVHLP